MATQGSPVELEKYLKGIHFPASKDDLLLKANANGAPDDIIDMINDLTEDNFNSPIDVSKAFGSR